MANTPQLITSALVIGAGPAGSACAAGLARNGIRTAIVEARPFPRVKVCGEYISPAGLPALHTLLTPASLEHAGARPITRIGLRLPGRDLTRPTTPGIALSRAALDDMLLEQARRAGAAVRQPARVHAVAYAPDAVRATLDTGETIEADIVIHADGSGRHDPGGPVRRAAHLVGAKCHLALPDHPEDAVLIRPARGAYIGTVRVENDLATCALVARADRLREASGNFDDLVTSAWPGFAQSDRATDWLACPVPRAPYTEPGHPRSVRLGNAAGAVDPLGGEGIGLALWSAVTFTDLLRAAAETGPLDMPSLRKVRTELARRYRRRLRCRAPACRLGAEALMRPAVLRAAEPVLASPRLAIAPWARLSGKPARGRTRPHAPRTLEA